MIEGDRLDFSRTIEPATVSALAVIVRTLPTLSHTTHELLALNLKDPELPDKLAAIVQSDPGLASHVLRLANSSAYASQDPIESVRPAISRVGAPMIVGTVLQAALHRVFDPYRGLGRRLAQIAVLEANLMSALATVLESRLQIAPEVAYAYGLLHDIGYLVMAIKFGKGLESFGHRRIPPDQVAQLEMSTFGFDHQSAGRLLCHQWKLPEGLAVAIATHHYPRELRTGHAEETNRLIDMLQMTDRLSRIVGLFPREPIRCEGAVADWLVTPEAHAALQAVGASADEVLRAVPVALAGMERDQKAAAS